MSITSQSIIQLLSDSDRNDNASEELIPPTLIEKQQKEQVWVEHETFMKVRKLLEARSLKNGASEDLLHWKSNILQPLMNHKAELLKKTKVVDDIMLKGGGLVKFLHNAITDKIQAKASKSEIVDICLQAWRALDTVIFHKTAKAKLSRNYNMTSMSTLECWSRHLIIVRQW